LRDYSGGEGFMNYTVEMGSEAITCIPGYIMIASGIQKLLRGGIRIRTHKQQGDLIKLL
jgi:hypothetical protein